MMRQRRKPAVNDELLKKGQVVDRLIAAGWSEPEIAKGLATSESAIDGLIKDVKGVNFWGRQAVVTSRVYDASIRAGRGLTEVLHRFGVDDATMQKRLRCGASISRILRDKRGIDSSQEAAAKVALIDNLLVVGFDKPKIAKGLGLSVRSLEKFYYPAATAVFGKKTTFKTREDELAREVTEASVRAGRTTKQILQQFDIDGTTLKDRLRRTGTRLVDIQEKVSWELLADAQAKIRGYMSKEWYKIPEGAEEHWQAIGKTRDYRHYQRAFHHFMEGGSVEEFREERGIGRSMADRIASVVMPEVKKRRGEIAVVVNEMLRPPVITEREKKVFELLAINDMKEAEASKALGEDHAGITAIKIILLGKFRELEGLVKYRGTVGKGDRNSGRVERSGVPP